MVFVFQAFQFISATLTDQLVIEVATVAVGPIYFMIYTVHFNTLMLLVCGEILYFVIHVLNMNLLQKN